MYVIYIYIYIDLLLWLVPYLMCTHINIYIYTYIHTLHYTTLHYTTLHYITLHYITLNQQQKLSTSKNPNFRRPGEGGRRPWLDADAAPRFHRNETWEIGRAWLHHLRTNDGHHSPCLVFLYKCFFFFPEVTKIQVLNSFEVSIVFSLAQSLCTPQ